MVKHIKFDFVNGAGIGCCHIDADCETVEDFKEALEFANEASRLMPQINKKVGENKSN